MFGKIARAVRLLFVVGLLTACEKEAAAELLLGESDGVVRILAIGNSFSADAIEQNLYELASAEGIVCEIGNLYIGGCSLERHVANSRTDAPNYEFRHIDTLGRWSNRPNTSIREVLEAGAWDFVSLQQVSQLAGRYETIIASLPELVDYVTRYSPGSTLLFHQTWAYARNATHTGFANYGNDQQQMYAAIMDAVERATKACGIACVVPAGTAIQNLRGTSVGDSLTRDGYHLNTLGRYTVACAWFELLFGLDVRQNSYFCSDLPVEQQHLAREAAHAAVASPYAVTEIGE